MLGAIKAASEGTGINRAALEFGVPKTTLKDRISGRVQHGSKSGRVPYLSGSEEQELVDYLITCSEIGYPKKRADVLGIVRKTLENKNGGPVDFNGKGWWLRFMQRYPELALQKHINNCFDDVDYDHLSCNRSDPFAPFDTGTLPSLHTPRHTPPSAVTHTPNPTAPNVIGTLTYPTVSTPSRAVSSTSNPIPGAITTVSKPTVSTSPSVISTLNPTVSTPSSVISTLNPTVSTPSSVISTLNPTVSTPSSVISTLDPTVSTPSRVISTLDPTVSTPSSVASLSTTPSCKRKALSPITQFLTYPGVSSTPKPKQNSSAGHGARVLTSLEAIALMEAKEKKKQDELEAKENRKKERIEKKQQREVEVKRKAEERERKAAARKQMAMEKEVEKKRKAELRLQKQIEKKSSETSRTTRRSHANSQPSTSGITLKVCDQNMCSVCLGTYEDDFVSGVLQREWIRCTNLENCGLWMHCDCVSLEKNRYVCYMCNVVLK